MAGSVEGGHARGGDRPRALSYRCHSGERLAWGPVWLDAGSSCCASVRIDRLKSEALIACSGMRHWFHRLRVGVQVRAEGDRLARAADADAPPGEAAEGAVRGAARR